MACPAKGWLIGFEPCHCPAPALAQWAAMARVLIRVDYCQRLDRHYTSFATFGPRVESENFVGKLVPAQGFCLLIAMRVPRLGAYFFYVGIRNR